IRKPLEGARDVLAYRGAAAELGLARADAGDERRLVLDVVVVVRHDAIDFVGVPRIDPGAGELVGFGLGRRSAHPPMMREPRRAAPPVSGWQAGGMTEGESRSAEPADVDAIRGVYRRASLWNEGDRDALLANPDALVF